jgi:autoinducer 2 (AI-2) kinase
MKILITAQIDEPGRARLARYGVVDYQGFADKMRLLAGKKLADALRDVDVFVTEVDQLRAPVLAQLDRLQVVGCCRGEPVNVDVAACTARGLPVLYTPGRNADAVAELTVCLILMLTRRVAPAMNLLRGGPGGVATMAQVFFEFKGRELWEKTVGLVGLGAVGRAVAARLQPFGVRLLAYDPYVAAEFAAVLGVMRVPLEQLLRQSDFVSLHTALTPETTGLIGAAQLAQMKPTAFFINTARAALVDENALADALRDKRIAGAAVDVFAEEPPPADHPLLMLDNVIATPHIGGNTAEVVVHQSRLIVEGLVALFEGRRSRFVANPEVLEGFRWRGT